MDTIHGRLFELQAYVDSLKFHNFLFFAFIMVALLLWPIGAILAIPVGLMAGKDRDMQMFKVFLVLGTIVGFILWTVPIVITMTGGGISHFEHLVFVKKELNFLDFIDFFLSELMILLFIAFAWMYHEIAIDVQRYKEDQQRSWRSQHDLDGIGVQFCKPQLQRIMNVLEKECPDYRTTVQYNEKGGKLLIQDLVRLCEVLPGWDSHIEATVEDNHVQHIGTETGLHSALSELSEEAKEKNIWPLDIWLVRHQWYPDTAISVWDGLRIAYWNARALLNISNSYMMANPFALTILILLSLTRTFLPRFWLHYILGGEFWPSDPYGPAGLVVAYSTLMTFVVSFCWIGLFYFVLMEYRRNLCQVILVSALVDARMRVVWSQSYLMSMFWFGMDSDKSEEVLGKMPLLDLRVSSNVAAFWSLREYVTLDRSNERMAVSILMEIIIVWITLKFCATIFTIYSSKTGLPAVLVVTLFDLFVFGSLVLFALQTALKLNDLMEKHKEVFAQAKYEVSMAHGRALREDEPKTVSDDLGLSRRLLNEYLDMVKEYDVRDCILFGLTVTPGSLVSSTVTIAGAIFTLFAQMVKSGELKVPEGVEDSLADAAQGGFMAVHSAVHFFAHNQTSF